MPAPRGHQCCIVWGAADDHTAVRMCPHCLKRIGEAWFEADPVLLEQQVARSRESHARLCKVGTTRANQPWQKGWKKR